MLDDVDAITPAPSPNTISPMPNLRTNRSISPTTSPTTSPRSPVDINRRRASIKAVEEGTDGDPDRLWMRMLALQQKFGCYNSARMSAALSSGNVSVLRPSKTCLDLLNEHMTALPESVIDWLRPN
ncbi:hypothetical protein GGR50DRAFT_446955 [Xylaria sp. CBS 124048]|nr:hypothetical protein GGR50DRAFT_446955 [Xylaria sp. CBS 124048]